MKSRVIHPEKEGVLSIDIDKVHEIQFGILDIDKSNVTAPWHFATHNAW